jgi:CPA2 family monovalent cation:H+ antiporter-2
LIESVLLFELLLLLALTAAGLALFERLRLPAIAGFLVAGALAGPGVFGLVSDPERVRDLAELGVVLLLFEIGLELPMERLRDLGRSALVVGGTQVLLTAGIVAVAASFFGLAPGNALVLGGLISMSSTALVMRLLSDEGQIDAPHGQLAVSVLVFQDLSIVPFLLAIPFLAEGGHGSASELVVAVVRMLGALAVVLFIVRYGVPRILNRVAEARSPDLFSLLALLIVLGSAFLAEELGLTLAVGAFLAGVAATSSPYSNQLFSEVVPLRGVILGIFFTAVGMLFEPSVLVSHAPLVLLYLLTTLLLKTTIVAAASTLVLRNSLRVGLLAGLALAQTGEFSFVLAEAANQAGLIDATLYQIVLAGSILSLVMTPFIMRAAPFIAERIATRLEGPSEIATGTGELADLDEEEETQRVIVIGYGPAGQTLTRLLRAIDVPYVVLDANAQAVRHQHAGDPRVIFGDATRPTVLERLAVDRARLVVIAISDPLATRRIVSRTRLAAPDTPILARTRFVEEVDLLEAAGATVVVAEEFEGSIAVVAQALERFQIPSGAIGRFTEALRDEGYGAIRSPAALPMDPWLVELLDQVGTEWVRVPQSFAHTVSLADLNVRAISGASILAVEHGGHSTTNPEAAHPVQAGDRLLVLGDAEDLQRLAALFDTPPGPAEPD